MPPTLPSAKTAACRKRRAAASPLVRRVPAAPANKSTAPPERAAIIYKPRTEPAR